MRGIFGEKTPKCHNVCSSDEINEGAYVGRMTKRAVYGFWDLSRPATQARTHQVELGLLLYLQHLAVHLERRRQLAPLAPALQTDLEVKLRLPLRLDHQHPGNRRKMQEPLVQIPLNAELASEKPASSSACYLGLSHSRFLSCCSATRDSKLLVIVRCRRCGKLDSLGTFWQSFPVGTASLRIRGSCAF